MIYVSSDHGGLELKNKLVAYLTQKNVEVTDMGPFELDSDDDYPEYVLPVVEAVLGAKDNKGMLICRNGEGVSMLANKFKGVRAVLSWNSNHAKSSRNDDDTNILALPADYITYGEAEDILETWLATPFSNAPRHQRRIQRVNRYGEKI